MLAILLACKCVNMKDLDLIFLGAQLHIDIRGWTKTHYKCIVDKWLNVTSGDMKTMLVMSLGYTYLLGLQHKVGRATRAFNILALDVNLGKHL